MNYSDKFFEIMNRKKKSIVKDTLINVIELTVMNKQINNYYELEYMLISLSKLTNYSKAFILKKFLVFSLQYDLHNKIIQEYLHTNFLDLNYILNKSILELSSYSPDIISVFLNCDINYVNSVLHSSK